MISKKITAWLFCGLALREFRGRLEKNSPRQVLLPSLANFFRRNPRTSSQILRLVKFIANFTLCVNLTHSVRALSSLRHLLASPANPLGFSWQSINSFFKFHALRENALRAHLVVIARICVANSWQSKPQSKSPFAEPLQVLR